MFLTPYFSRELLDGLVGGFHLSEHELKLLNIVDRMTWFINWLWDLVYGFNET